jgi:hypothetical protein
MKMRQKLPVNLVSICTADALALSSDDKGLTFEIELIYLGDFRKKNDTQDISFSVDDGILEHWHNTVAAMLSNGVDIPVAIEHSTDPTKKAGDLLSTSIKQNAKGVNALYGVIKFIDADKAKLAKSANVSVNIAAQKIDGLNRVYYRPITHVALTNYPVIPGLEPFTAISLSLSEQPKMDLRALATKLGIQDSVPDDQLPDAIAAAIDAMLKQLADMKEPDTDDKPPAVAASNPPKVAPVQLSLVRSARTTRVNDLVSSGKIVPAVATKLTGKFCTDKAIELAFTGVDDGFEDTVSALSLNETVATFNEKSGRQTIALSDAPRDNEKNPLLADAQRRAAASKR